MTDSTPKLIPLFKYAKLVGYALVDPEDYARLSVGNWTLSRQGYAVTTTPGMFDGVTLMHRVVAGNDSETVDHINHVRTDNRTANLRGCTKRENNYNRRNPRSKAGLRGVSQDQRDKRWQAEISHAGKRLSLGRYDSAEIAAYAYDAAARQLHGEFAILNYPEIQEFEGVDWQTQSAQNVSNRKLTMDTVREIRKQHNEGESVSQLAAKAGISCGAVYAITRGYTYKETPPPATLELALERIERGEATHRVARALGIGVKLLRDAVKEKWGDTPPSVTYKRRSNAKLTAMQVREIISRAAAGERQKDLAKEFGVSLACVNGYVKGHRRIE